MSNGFFTVDPFPLVWPEGWPRTPDHKREHSLFYNNTIGKARTELLAEVRRLGGQHVVISSNLPLRQDGLPAAVRTRITDPGVAIYFARDSQGLCIPCDKWLLIEDNLRAITKTIEALRGIERWGAKQMVDAAFSGFAALPEQTSGSGWWDVLGLRDSTVPRELIEQNYRALAKQFHPDVGGDPELWHAIQLAYEQATAAKGGA